MKKKQNKMCILSSESLMSTCFHHFSECLSIPMTLRLPGDTVNVLLFANVIYLYRLPPWWQDSGLWASISTQSPQGGLLSPSQPTLGIISRGLRVSIIQLKDVSMLERKAHLFSTWESIFCHVHSYSHLLAILFHRYFTVQTLSSERFLIAGWSWPIMSH